MNRVLVFRLLAGGAMAVQAVLLYYFFAMGLGWAGLWYLANLAQALVILGVAVFLLIRRPLLALPLPVISFLLMLAFQALDPSTKTTECAPAEQSVVALFPPPPGSPSTRFQSEPTEGCIARFDSSLPPVKILDHYRLAARKAGWEVVEAPPERHSVTLKGDSMIVSVMVVPQEQGLVIVSVSERGR